jgi:hypothetical protein
MKRGVKPMGKVKREWSPSFAYAIGLLTSDGCLLNDGRHIDFTSKDKNLCETFKQCLGLNRIKIGVKSSGSIKHTNKKYFRVQFGDVLFYQFLLGVGLFSAKSKELGELDIPKKYFFDFLRGHFDGDGTFYSYFDPRWKNSFMFYTVFISSSKQHILWLRELLRIYIRVSGHISHDKKKSTYLLRYAKKESIIVLKKMYHNKAVPCLVRKRLKINRALAIIGKKL